jgi:hypothetical protein
MAIRTRTVSLLAVVGTTVATALAACGGGEKPPVVPPPQASTDVVASAAPSASAAPVASASVSAPPPAPTSTVATTKSDATWASCHQKYQGAGRDFVHGSKDVAKDVGAMADGCKVATKLKLVGKTLTGDLAEHGAPQSFPLEAKAGHCYRVYAMASDGLKDLDVVLKDSAQIVVGQDSTDDPSPVVSEDGAVCFSKDDKASVVVTLDAPGKGSFALQIWSD